MVTIPAQDYPALKGFFGWMAEKVLAMPPGLAPEDHPLAVLARFEARSMGTARQGLAQAIGDIVEMTENYPPSRVAELDRSLSAEGLPTLTEVRLRFWKKITSIMRRGKVRSESEYHALRNVVDSMPQQEQATAWEMLGEYEASFADRGPQRGKP